MDNKAPEVKRHTLTVIETAAYVGVSKECIYEMVRKKQIPHIRAQSRILFRVSTLDAWMEQEEKRNLVAQ